MQSNVRKRDSGRLPSSSVNPADDVKLVRKSHTRKIPYKVGYTWNKGGRLNELRIRCSHNDLPCLFKFFFYYNCPSHALLLLSAGTWQESSCGFGCRTPLAAFSLKKQSNSLPSWNPARFVLFIYFCHFLVFCFI